MDLITVDLVTGISELRSQAYIDYFSEYGLRLVGLVLSLLCLCIFVGILLSSKLTGIAFYVVALTLVSSGVDRAVQKKG